MKRNKIFLAIILSLLLMLSFSFVSTVKAAESEYKDYHQSKSQTVNGDFEAFEIGTKLSENQLEGAWGTVTSYDNAAQISLVDGSHVLDLPGGSKKYTSAFLILPDSLDVNTIVRFQYDVKFDLTEDILNYDYLDTSLVGGSNVEYYIINFKAIDFEDLGADLYTTGASSVQYPIKVEAKENGWYTVTFDAKITRKDLIQVNSLRFLAILKSEEDHIYFDNVNLYYLTEEEVIETVDVQSLTINDGIQLQLSVGEEKTLSYTVNPENATDKSVTFSSSKPEIATVDANGKINALAVGSTVISVKSSNNIEAQIAVIVKETAPVVTEPVVTQPADTPADDTPAKTKKGCNGSITGLVVASSVIVVLASGLVIRKKK